MKKQTLVLMLAILLVSPVTGFAVKTSDHADQSMKMDMDHNKTMDMNKDKEMDHGSMDMGGGVIMLQDHEVAGVIGSAHLMDVKEAMAKHGMNMTHHIMIGFKDAAGKQLSKGSVAVKINSPDATVGEPVKMMAMDGYFGADISLTQKGMHHFTIGTKLADGQKRTFNFQYEN